MACAVRTRVPVLVVGALLSLHLADPRPTRAACSTMPPAPEVFCGAKGSIDRPFVVPGDVPSGPPGWEGWGSRITLSLDGCQAGGAKFDKQKHVVAIVFNPPSDGPRNALLFAHNCADVDKAACENQLSPNGEATCLNGQLHIVASPPHSGCKLWLDVPAGLPELAGPAAIVVTEKNALRCDIGGQTTPTCQDDTHPSPPLFCVDDLFKDATDCSSTVPHEVFPSFTVLPPLNDFKKLCKDKGPAPKCALDPSGAFRFAIDKQGNALVPVLWKGALRAAGGTGPPCPAGSPCDTRQLQGFTAVDPFPDDPTKDVVQLPAGVVRSFNMRGAEYVPSPVQVVVSSGQSELRIDGYAHKGKSVLRIPSCDDSQPCTPNTFFDFRGRMKNGVGPIEIPRAGGPGVCDTTSGKKCKSDAECASGVCVGFRAFALGHTPGPIVPPGPPTPPPSPSQLWNLAVAAIVAVVVVLAMVIVWRWRSQAH